MRTPQWDCQISICNSVLAKFSHAARKQEKWMGPIWESSLFLEYILLVLQYYSDLWKWSLGMIRWFLYTCWYPSQIKMVATLYTFTSVCFEFLPVCEIQEQKGYQKELPFLPSHIFNLSSAILIGGLNLMAFPNGSLIKTNICDISYV